MKKTIQRLIASCAIALLVACGNDSGTSPTSAETAKNASSIPAVSLAMSVDSKRSEANASQISPMSARSHATAPAATLIDLGAPIASLSAQEKNAVAEMGKPLQVSFGRNVSKASTVALTNQALNWQSTLSGGHVAAVSITSTGAKALRIGLLINKLPDTATLRYYSQKASTAYTITAKDALAAIANNAAAGDTSADGRTFWGPVVEGSEATVEIELSAGINTSHVEIALPQVSHFFMTASDVAGKRAMTTYGWPQNDSLSCQVDVKCTTLPTAADSVALLYFQKNGSGFQCSGTLLNNTANDLTPYLLTANHCISTQTEASTLTTWWLYRSNSCNATSGNYQQVAGGSTLLYTAYDTDATLVRMLAAPPAGTLFVGWDASPQTVATPVVGIHHPQADSQRMSSGTIVGYFNRVAGQPNNFTGSTQANSSILEVNYTSGIVEPGSSGSGLFKNASSASPQLIGSLYGGDQATCSAPGTSAAQSTVYGRFDYAFAGGMNIWLNPVAVAANPNRQPVYRFYIPQQGVYFYTIYPSERDYIFSNLAATFKYEGVAFYASPSQITGFDPIYRFRNTSNGSYLYTISDVEKASILQFYPNYVLEGIAWYAQKAAVNDGMPLYRFRTTNSTHIYTAYESEKTSILTNYPGFVLEGPAYYVKLTP